MKNYPFIGYSISFVVGILLNKYLGIDFNILLVLLLLNILILIPLKKFHTSQVVKISVYILFLFLGGLVLSIHLATKKFLPEEFPSNEAVVVIGDILTIDLIKKDEISFKVKSDSIRIANIYNPYQVVLLCKVHDKIENLERLYDKMSPGNTVRIKGIFQRGREKRNPGEFDYDYYLKTQNISGLIYIQEAYDVKILDWRDDLFKNAIFRLRKYLNSQINHLHNEQAAGLIRGLLLADRSGIDYKTKSEFVNSGVVHILAVSGLHVGFIALIFLVLLGRFNLYIRSIVTIIGLIIFLILTQMPASVFRAVTMASVVIAAYITNRTTNIFNSLAVAAFIVLLVNPEDLFNPGFQLSFSAVLSIAIIYPLIQKFIYSIRIKSQVIRYLLLFMAVSLSAQIGTMPFTFIYFEKLSMVSLLTNLFVIPLAGLIVGVSILTLVISFVSLTFASIFSLSNEFLIFILFKIVSFVGGLEQSFIYIRDFTVFDAIIFYVALAFIIFTIERTKELKAKVIIILLVLVNSFVFSRLDNKKILLDDKLNIFIPDLSAGNSVLINFPNEHNIFINAGKTSFYFDNFNRILKPLLEYLNIKRLDLAVLTNNSEQNLSGFISLMKNQIADIHYFPQFDTLTILGLAFNKFITSIQINSLPQSIEQFEIGKGKCYFLTNSSAINNDIQSADKSIGMIKLVFGKTSILFHNGVTRGEEDLIMNNYENFLKSDVLVLAEFNANVSVSIEFLKNVSPKYLVFSDKGSKSFTKMESIVSRRMKMVNSDFTLLRDRKAFHLVSDGEKIFINEWEN